MQITLPWRTGQAKPFGSIPRINWDHPLAQGLKLYHYDAGGTGGYELVLNRRMSIVGTYTFVRQSTPWGTGYVPLSGNITGRLQYTIDATVPLTGPRSAMTGFYKTATAAESTATFFGIANSGLTSIKGWVIADHEPSSGGKVGYRNNSLGPGFGFSASLNAYHTLAVTSVDVTNIKMYGDAALVGSLNSGTSGFDNTSVGDILLITGDAGGPNGFQGGVFWGGVWNRILTQAEVTQLHNDPYCFLIYPEDEMFATLVGTGIIPPVAGISPQFFVELEF